MKKILRSTIILLTTSVLILSCNNNDDNTTTITDFNINIPNAIVKALLVNNVNINTNGDTEIQESEAIAFTGEIVITPNQGVDDLTGIERFINITILRCTNNDLTSLNLSTNTAMIKLYCTNNLLTNLDVSNNTNLKELYCSGNSISILNLSNNNVLELLWCRTNSLTTLNLSSNTSLKQLICKGNILTSLDVSANNALTYLYCQNNNLNTLNVANGNNANFTHFNAAFGNANLTCVQIDPGFTPSNNWNINSNTSYSTSCN